MRRRTCPLCRMPSADILSNFGLVHTGRSSLGTLSCVVWSWVYINEVYYLGFRVGGKVRSSTRQHAGRDDAPTTIFQPLFAPHLRYTGLMTQFLGVLGALGRIQTWMKQSVQVERRPTLIDWCSAAVGRSCRNSFVKVVGQELGHTPTKPRQLFYYPHVPVSSRMNAAFQF